MELRTLITECTAYDYRVTYMEKRGSGLTRICNETKALDGYKDELKPMFKSTPTQFQTTIYASSDEPDIEDVTKDVTKGDTQSDTQGDTQGGTQNGTLDGPQENELDVWIESQIRKNPKVTTEELAKLSNKGVATIKRHLSKLPHITYVGSGYSGHWEITKE